ncbi:DMT family transporter [uncultured Ferrimonas sp.]|uniref:DMT family transporter n=1 Tax=uncultured Ferrimonas sp. TaxID=432640 RepID=UPI002635C93A|nr:DMT family transporter [uncultured Ferrimonas sp.]
MLDLMITVAIGLIGGIAVGTQAPIAAAMSQRVGGAASSVIVHAGGLVASLLLLFGRGGEGMSQWRELPWYMLGCGALGLVLYLTISHTMPKLGAVAAIALIIIGQLVAGVVIDSLGAFGAVPKALDLTRLVGIGVLLLGAYLVIK